MLGSLAVKRPWNKDRIDSFETKYQELKDLEEDAKDIVELPYQATRRILAQEKVNLPEGVTNVNVVASYQSENELSQEWRLDKAFEINDKLGILFEHQLALPAFMDGKRALEKAIKLSNNNEFKENRREFYLWQNKVINEGIDPKNAVKQMQQLALNYNKIIKSEYKKVYLKAAFTLCGVSLGILGATLWNPIALTSAGLSIVQFLTFDRKPVISAGEAKPAAMFHDVKSKLGISLSPKKA